MQTKNNLFYLSDLFSNRRSQNDCSYRSCAQCLNDVDCFGDQYCSQGSCITRTRNYNNYNNYNYGSSGSFGSSAGVSAGSSSSGGIPSSWLRGWLIWCNVIIFSCYKYKLYQPDLCMYHLSSSVFTQLLNVCSEPI